MVHSGVQIKGHIRLPRVSIRQVIEDGELQVIRRFDLTCLQDFFTYSSHFTPGHANPLYNASISHIAKSTVKVSLISVTLIPSNSTCLEQGTYLATSVLNFMPFSLSATLYALRRM